MVLTHLILNDMIKVRGQIGAIALAIEDQDSKIADLAKYLFNELASKVLSSVYACVCVCITCLPK